jgi:flagellar biosynthesis protein FliP
MNATEDIRHLRTGHPTHLEVTADVVEVTGGGLRIAEIALVILLGLLVCPPFLILAVVVAAPLIAMTAIVVAVVAAIAVPTLLVRRVLAHHRAHGSTLFLHRVWS